MLVESILGRVISFGSGKNVTTRWTRRDGEVESGADGDRRVLRYFRKQVQRK